MIAQNIEKIKKSLPDGVELVAVSKFHAAPSVMHAYRTGHRIFGESRVQELCDKAPLLPNDIQWHFIGPLQRNKVKYIAPFISLVHSLDSLSLFQEIFKQAQKCQRPIPCLLEIKIAQEDAKSGWDQDSLLSFLDDYFQEPEKVRWVPLQGLMGMATLTSDNEQIAREFASLYALREVLKEKYPQGSWHTLSMGMSSDWEVALQAGSNMVRIGTSIFGEREY